MHHLLIVWKFIMPFKPFAIALFMLLPFSLFAEEPDLTQLRNTLREWAPPESIQPTPVPGLYEVIVNGQILYLSKDGKFALLGNMIDLSSSANLTEARRGQIRLKAMEAMGADNMIIFSPSIPAKHKITVFTDVDCVYCRRLHQDISSYLDKGIEVRYLMYPRAGVGSSSYNKAVAVWCSEDRKDAMTRAKQGEDIELKTCPNPVQAHYQLGQDFGVRGTPSIILESGDMLPGYVPADRLAQMLDSGS